MIRAMKKQIEDFETIYHANYEIISKHVLFKLVNISDAQDIVSDVFYDFYKHWIKSETVIEHPSAYLKTIANHHIAEYYKQHHLEDTLKYNEDYVFSSIEDPLNLESSILDASTVDTIFNEINQLGEPDKTILVARFRFDLTFREIAEKLNMKESTIKSIAQKQLLNLKDKFSSK